MNRYSYEYEYDGIYCYKNTSVLKNKIGLKDATELNEAEREITAVRYIYAKERPIKGNFDFKHLCSIHRYLFSDIYTWAGKPRTVNISKGNQFCLAQHIESYAEQIFTKLKNENYLKDSDNTPHRLAYYMSEINVLHPFREGNGRTQRLFIEYLADYAGYKVDFTSVTPEEMIRVSADSFACEYDSINAMFERITYKI